MAWAKEFIADQAEIGGEKIMKSIIIDIFGQYEPIIVELTDGSETVQADYPYIFGVLMFALVVYSVFRIIGSLWR